TATAQQQQQTAVVGPLYGKLTFRAVPDAKKIVVITQIPEAFDVIEKFVQELDLEELAEMPEVVVLKYADPEDLCERLNAMLNRDGTQAPYRLTTSTLSSYGSGATAESEAGQTAADETYQPWWNSGAGQTTTEQPISTLIGKVRFIPDRRSKAILYLAPVEYREQVKEMINKLDQPARQVVIKAVIMEVNHEKLTALGVKFSTNPGAFGVLGESAISDWSTLFYADTFNMVEFTTALNVSTLVDFLVKETNAKVLNQPTVWAKDNEEATFFSGGTIPFIATSQSSPEQTSTTQTYSQLNVGVTLRVKPNITPDEDVDMTVNLIVSQEGPQILNNTSTTETNTTTHMIVENGKTIMLSGYIFQNDMEIVRKFPLLGDIPLVGGLFRHNETEQVDRELLIFITPQVVDIDEETRDIILSEENQLAVQKMLDLKKELDAWLLEIK
ncbi:MAG: hypothetical protein AMJ79_04565, partial [Phycisphaerae bacterium SM23_30]